MRLSRRWIGRKKQGSSALVLVLIAVVLTTSIILAILLGAQVARRTAFYYDERIHADALAQAGIQSAEALLRTDMGDTNETFYAAPGRMLTVTNATGTSSGQEDLYSGIANAGLTGVYACPNLNAKMFDGTYPLAGDGSTMQVKWIYVRRDGTLDQADVPATIAANPLVGRYAFWVDSASSRLNLNTAWGRSTANTNAPGDVSRVDLSVGLGSLLAGEAQGISSTNLFNSEYDLRAADLVSAVETNRFAYTFYNHTFEGLNPFGRPKIYLTTQPAYLPPGLTSVASSTNDYLDILAGTPTSYVDPGIVTNLDDKKIAAAVNNIYSYLTNTTWPEAPGTSFAQKYWGAASDPRIFQLAVNIVEYVRAKESKQKIINAIRGSVAGNVFTSSTVGLLTVANAHSTGGTGAFPGATVAMPIMGVTRTPRITEFGAYWANDGQGGIVFQTELYLPPNVGIHSVAGADIYVPHEYFMVNTLTGPAGTRNDYTQVTYKSALPDSGAVPSNTKFYDITGHAFPLTPGNYVEVKEQEENATYGTNDPPTTVWCWAGIGSTENGNTISLSTCAPLDWGGSYPTPNGSGNLVGPIALPTAVTTPQATSLQVDDPLLGLLAANWVSAGTSWGAANSGRSVGNSPGSYSPPQDTDANGKVTDLGWRLPYPMGDATNPNGRMDSLAELGYVNTGAIGWISGNNYGTPYRTLRFQPSGATLPDWALLDLFALPPGPTAAATNFISQPYLWTNSAGVFVARGGQVNVNAALYPFTTVVRPTPLIGLLSGSTNPMTATTLPASTAGTLATNIISMTLATAGKSYDSTGGVINHLGELAEISGMADKGELSEGNLFEPFAQGTVRGNVFVVYSVGQALQQTPTGTVIVNGEKRYEAAVEQNPSVSPSAETTSKLFNTVVLRELNP